MSQVLILQHLDREGPGRIAEVCQHRGLPVEILRLDLGARVPISLPKGTLLVVLGGSMGVADLGDPRFAFLAREIDLLREVLR